MKKAYSWIATLILIASAIAVVNQGVYLWHAVEDTTDNKKREVEELLAIAINKTAMDAVKTGFWLKYDMSTGDLYYMFDSTEVKRTNKEAKDSYWLATIPLYDIRDTAKWKLETLHNQAESLIREKTGQEIAMRLTERDSTRRTLQAFGGEALEGGQTQHFEMELGVMDKGKVEADFVIPYDTVAKEMAGDLLYWVAVVALLGCCLHISYRLAKAEQRREEARKLYMSLYRHDLRTPIDTVQKRLYQLKEAGKEKWTEKEREALEAIDRATMQVSRGVEQLMAVQVGERDVTEKAEPVDANQTLREVVERERWYAAGEEGTRIELETEDGKATVEGYREALESVFQNLIENARKHAGPGTEVHVSSRRNGTGALEVTVADNGTGIPREELAHIFDKHYRGSRQTEWTKGTGMGLYMARLIVKAHGGELNAKSEPGKGCRFVIVLPLK